MKAKQKVVKRLSALEQIQQWPKEPKVVKKAKPRTYWAVEIHLPGMDPHIETRSPNQELIQTRKEARRILKEWREDWRGTYKSIGKPFNATFAIRKAVIS